MGVVDKIGSEREYDKAERWGDRPCRISITVEATDGLGHPQG
jgi:hypothetical protein